MNIIRRNVIISKYTFTKKGIAAIRSMGKNARTFTKKGYEEKV